MGRSTNHHELPQSDDPIWEEFGDVVLDTLYEPKTVRELKTWARKEKFQIGRLYNALAWLDMRGLVLFDRTSAPEPLWKRTDPKPAPSPVLLMPLPKYCTHCHGLMKAEPHRIACILCGRGVYPPLDPLEIEEGE